MVKDNHAETMRPNLRHFLLLLHKNHPLNASRDKSSAPVGTHVRCHIYIITVSLLRFQSESSTIKVPVSLRAASCTCSSDSLKSTSNDKAHDYFAASSDSRQLGLLSRAVLAG